MSAPKSLRRAEEIAREMVVVDRHGARVQDAQDQAPILYGESRAPAMRDIIARVIEQARTDGAAAKGKELGEVAASHVEAIDHYREGLHRIWQGEADPREIAACYLGEDPPARRDIAGRIRALVQEYAGRWADETDAGTADAYEEVVRTLRACVASLRDGTPGSVRAAADVLRAESEIPGRYSRSSAAAAAPLAQAADELEAIVRECEEKR